MVVDSTSAVQVAERRDRALVFPFGPPPGTKPLSYPMVRICTVMPGPTGSTSRRPPAPRELTADHDGTLVARPPRRVFGRHDGDYALELTGPAGLSGRRGQGGTRADVDAVEVTRSLPARAPRPGLPADHVPS